MIESAMLSPGEYTLGVRKENTPHPFATLWIFPRSERAKESPGQWILELRPTALDAAGLPASGWAELLGRLGLHPVDIDPRLLEKLQSKDPVAIIADTSAILSGAAHQICRLRTGRPTHFAVPDQVYMEIHSQREDETLGKKASQRVRTNLAMFMAVRHLRRLRADGHVIHFARPPEAMVRYLGTERGGTGADEKPSAIPPVKAPNYVRDRLVIEAARATHRAAPEMPLYLLTTDVKLALQAEVEQFRPALCRVPELPASPRYGSPWISPYTLELRHLPIADLIDEITWTLGGTYLQLKGEAEATTWQLPAVGNDSARLLLRGDSVKPDRVSVPRDAASVSTQDVPKKPPSVAAFMEGLIKLTDRVGKPTDLAEEGPFLVAFGWASREGDRYVAMPAGLDAGNRWKALKPDDVLAWCDWMDIAAAAALRVSTVRDAVQVIRALNPGQGSDEELMRGLSLSREIARRLAVFAAGFGTLIRIDGKLWAPRQIPDAEAEVLEAIRRVASQAGASAAPAEKVFTDLLPRAALPLHVFRRAVHGLVSGEKIERDRGTMSRPPKTGEGHVRLRVLLPGGEGEADFPQIDLSAGDFLIPGITMQDLVPRGAHTWDS